MSARSSGGGEEDLDVLALRLATDEENATFTVRKRLFYAIGVLNIAMNFDSGVLPATCVCPCRALRLAPSAACWPARLPAALTSTVGARRDTGSGTCSSSSTFLTPN